MRNVWRIGGGAIALGAVAALGFYGWASSTTQRMQAVVIEAHETDLAGPVPLKAMWAYLQSLDATTTGT